MTKTTIAALLSLLASGCPSPQDEDNDDPVPMGEPEQGEPAPPRSYTIEISSTWVFQAEEDSDFAERRWRIDVIDEAGNLDVAVIDRVLFVVLDAEGNVLVNPFTGELQAAEAEGTGNGYVVTENAVIVSSAQAQLAAPKAAHAVAPHCEPVLLYVVVETGDGQVFEDELWIDPINPGACS